MSLPAISVENLGKKYLISHRRGESYTALRDVLARNFVAPFRWVKRSLQGGRTSSNFVSKEEFWALKDVSFEVREGDVVGIIGRNGAGKSTLLKTLSRITEPTTGRIRLRGRVASLLEVGTGFHPELTGRENIFLNGAILGMSNGEILRKFDEIVAFAEVEKFLDTPVKRYSSGMYVRLAFAVAAHLDPEILIIDEVLAVGDSSFQKKCLNKMETVGRSGRTVLFVSHNMPAITRLCSRIVLLGEGRILQEGPTHEVVRAYMSSDQALDATRSRRWDDPRRAPGNEVVRLRSICVRSERRGQGDAFDIRYPIAVEFEFDVLQGGFRLSPNFHLFDQEGTRVFVAADQDSEWRTTPRPVGRFRSTAWIPGNLLSEGSFVVSAAISTLDPVAVHLFEADVVMFHVQDPSEGDSARGDYVGEFPGAIRPLLRWTNEYLSERTTAELK
jgi:lipopolysaccharide transport system ATP-binding protein